MPKAIAIPTPAFPVEARKRHISGKVIVRVVVGEDGSVIEAHAESGDELLRKAAEDAASNARFKPAMSVATPKQPMKVVGLITYNFVLDNGKRPNKKAKKRRGTHRASRSLTSINGVRTVDAVTEARYFKCFRKNDTILYPS
ncbi:MAG: energy transducer TonB [Acidobacteriota bacterium]